VKRIPHRVAILFVALCSHATALTSKHYNVAPQGANLALGRDGNIWYPTLGGVGRVTPDGDVESFIVDPSLEFDYIATGSDGNVWSVSRYTDALYAWTTAGAVAHNFPLPANISYGAMTAGADGRMWISSVPGTVPVLTAVDAHGGVTTYPLPGAISLVAGPDGNLWATDDSHIHRVNTSGTVTTFDMPLEGSSPTAGGTIVAGPDGKLWMSANTAGCPLSPCVMLGAALVSVTVDGSVAIYPTPDADSSSAVSLAFGADGNPWLAARRLNPETFDYDSVLVRKTPDNRWRCRSSFGASIGLPRL